MKTKNKTTEQKWTTPVVDGRGLIGCIALLVLNFLVSVYPCPESWQFIVSVGTCWLYLLTAYAWAEVAAHERWIFWLCFCLGLIPYVRLAVFLCITVYTIGILLWDKLDEITRRE